MASTAPTAPLADGLADTFPKLLLHNAANWPNAVAMREKDSASGTPTAGPTTAPGAGDRARAAEPRARPRRGGRADRPQPAELGLVRARRAGVGAHVARRLRGCAGRGGCISPRATPGPGRLAEDEEQVDKLLEIAGRMPTALDRLPRSARHGEIRRPPAGRLGAAAARGRERAGRPGASSRGGQGPGDDVASCAPPRHDRAPQARDAAAPAVPRAIGAYLPPTRGIPRTSMSRSCRCPGSWSRSMSWRCRCSAGSGQLPGEPDTAMADLREIGPTHLLLAPPRLGADRGRRPGAGHGCEPR